MRLSSFVKNGALSSQLVIGSCSIDDFKKRLGEQVESYYFVTSQQKQNTGNLDHEFKSLRL